MARAMHLFHRGVLAALGLAAVVRTAALAWEMRAAAPDLSPIGLGPAAVACAVVAILMGLGRLPMAAISPTRWFHLPVAVVVGIGGFVGASLLMALKAHRLGLPVAPRTGPIYVVDTGAGIALVLLCLTAAVLVATARRAPTERPICPVTEKPQDDALPDLGFFMWLYTVTDWLLLRLCGLGLLATAWMIHGQDARGRAEKVALILHGMPPQTAVTVYAAWGALLAVPVVLPRVLARPSTILGGAMKAAILVGLSLLFIPAIDLAIDLHVPREYRGVMHEAVPRLFKAVAGVAILSTMAVALFRQLGRTPTPVAPSPRAPRIGATELRALRVARMPEEPTNF